MLVIPMRLEIPLYDIPKNLCYDIQGKEWYLSKTGCPEKEFTRIRIDVEPEKFSRIKKVKEAVKKMLGWKSQCRLEIGDAVYHYAVWEGNRLSIGQRIIPKGDDKKLSAIKFPTTEFSEAHFLKGYTEPVWLDDSTSDLSRYGRPGVRMMVSLCQWHYYICKLDEISYCTTSHRCNRNRPQPGDRLSGAFFQFAFKDRRNRIFLAEVKAKYWGFWDDRGLRFCGDKPNSNGYLFTADWECLYPDSISGPGSHVHDEFCGPNTDGTGFGIYKTGKYEETVQFRNGLLRQCLNGIRRVGCWLP